MATTRLGTAPILILETRAMSGLSIGVNNIREEDSLFSDLELDIFKIKLYEAQITV